MAPKSLAAAHAQALPTNIPTEKQIALALAIVKAKPPRTTARDYVLRLREHFRPGRQYITERQRSRYLDVAGYWQQRSMSAEQKIAELEIHIAKLERSNRCMQDILDADGHKAAGTGSAKRKRDASPAKRSKKTKASEPNASSAEATIEDDFDFLDGIGEAGPTLTQHLWTVQKLCRRPTADPEAVCSSLVQSASALGHVVSAIAKHHDRLTNRTRPNVATTSLAQDKSEFAFAISACARSFAMILSGLKNVASEGGGRRLTGLVTYELVKMYAAALDAVERSARLTAVTHFTSNSDKHSKRACSKPVEESAAARGIAHFLIGLMACLDKNNPLHQQIFDGFTYVLFERVGKRLFYCTFGRHRSATVEGDIALLPEPATPAEVAKKDTEALAITFEVKAVVLVLERAMGLAPEHMNPQAAKGQKNSNRTRTLSVRNLPAASKGRLSPIAKDRLQRTLVTCMFGEKVEDELLDVITMPIRLPPVPNVPKMTDKSVEEWYQSQVWRLVGWDVLARESEWSL